MKRIKPIWQVLSAVIFSLGLICFWFFRSLWPLFAGSKSSLSILIFTYQWAIIGALGIMGGTLFGFALRKKGISKCARNVLFWIPTIGSNLFVIANFIGFIWVAVNTSNMAPYRDIGLFIWMFSALPLVLSFPINFIWNIVNLWISTKKVVVFITLILLLFDIALLQSPACMRMQNFIFD